MREHMIWVTTANSNTCRIYHFDKHPAKLTLLKEISHPENKLKKAEFFTSDKPGRYQADPSAHGTYSQRTDPKEVEIDHFAREIAEELNRGRNAQEYKKLIIVTAPHMQGLIFQHLDKHVQELIVNDIQKDVMHLAQHDLLDFLKTHAQYEQS